VSPLTLTLGVVDAVVDETRLYGSRNLETGGFLTAPTSSDDVTRVAVAGTTGIVRHPDLFQISERALDRLFSYADDNRLWMPVQFHSHHFGADMSRTDALHGLRVEGFISTILPRFVNPPEDVSEWGWWQFTDGEWRPFPPIPIARREPGRVLVFDEDGVRER
jgi:hypothetical protein